MNTNSDVYLLSTEDTREKVNSYKLDDLTQNTYIASTSSLSNKYSSSCVEEFTGNYFYQNDVDMVSESSDCNNLKIDSYFSLSDNVYKGKSNSKVNADELNNGQTHNSLNSENKISKVRKNLTDNIIESLESDDFQEAEFPGNLKIDNFFSLSDCGNNELESNSVEELITDQEQDHTDFKMEISKLNNENGIRKELMESADENLKAMESYKLYNSELQKRNSNMNEIATFTSVGDKKFYIETCENKTLGFVIPYQDINMYVNSNYSKTYVDKGFSDISKHDSDSVLTELSRSTCSYISYEYSTFEKNPVVCESNAVNSAYEVETMVNNAKGENLNSDVSTENKISNLGGFAAVNHLKENLLNEDGLTNQEQNLDNCESNSVDFSDSEDLELLLFQSNGKDTSSNLKSEELKSFLIDDVDDDENQDIDVGSFEAVPLDLMEDSVSKLLDSDCVEEALYKSRDKKLKVEPATFVKDDSDEDVEVENFSNIPLVKAENVNNESKLLATEIDEEPFEGFDDVYPKKINLFKEVVTKLAKEALSQGKSYNHLLHTLENLTFSDCSRDFKENHYLSDEDKYKSNKEVSSDSPPYLFNGNDDIKKVKSEFWSSDLQGGYYNEINEKSDENCNKQIKKEKVEVSPSNFSSQKTRKYDLRKCKHKYISSNFSDRLIKDEDDVKEPRKRSLSNGSLAYKSKETLKKYSPNKKSDVLPSYLHYNSSQPNLIAQSNIFNSSYSYSENTNKSNGQLDSSSSKKRKFSKTRVKKFSHDENILKEGNSSQSFPFKKINCVLSESQSKIGDNKNYENKVNENHERNVSYEESKVDERHLNRKAVKRDKEGTRIEAFDKNSIENSNGNLRKGQLLKDDNCNQNVILCDKVLERVTPDEFKIFKENQESNFKNKENNVKKQSNFSEEENQRNHAVDKENKSYEKRLAPTNAFSEFFPAHPNEINKWFSDQKPYIKNYEENDKLRLNYAYMFMNEDRSCYFKKNEIVPPNTCPCCFKTVSNVDIYIHLSQHFQGEILKCVNLKCDFKTHVFQDLLHHIKTHKLYKSRIYKCKHCKNKFYGILSTIYHLKLHEKAFICSLCFIKFADVNAMKIHKCHTSFEDGVNGNINLMKNKLSRVNQGVHATYNSNYILPQKSALKSNFIFFSPRDYHDIPFEKPASLRSPNDCMKNCIKVPVVQENENAEFECKDVITEQKDLHQDGNKFPKAEQERKIRNINFSEPFLKVLPTQSEDQNASKRGNLKFRIVNNHILSSLNFVGCENVIFTDSNNLDKLSENNKTFTQLNIYNENLVNDIKHKVKPEFGPDGCNKISFNSSDLQTCKSSCSFSNVNCESVKGPVFSIGKNLSSENHEFLLSDKLKISDSTIDIFSGSESKNKQLRFKICEGKSVCFSDHKCKRPHNFSRKHTCTFDDSFVTNRNQSVKFTVCRGRAHRGSPLDNKKRKYSSKEEPTMSKSLQRSSVNHDDTKMVDDSLEFLSQEDCIDICENVESNYKHLNKKEESLVYLDEDMKSLDKLSSTTVQDLSLGTADHVLKSKDEVSSIHAYEKQLSPQEREKVLIDGNRLPIQNVGDESCSFGKKNGVVSVNMNEKRILPQETEMFANDSKNQTPLEFLEKSEREVIVEQQIPHSYSTFNSIYEHKENVDLNEKVKNVTIKDDKELHKCIAEDGENSLKPINSSTNSYLDSLHKEVEKSRKESLSSSSNHLYHCNYCSFGTDKLFKLNIHLNVHSELNPFECVFCPETFSTSKHLKCHMMTHTKEV